MKRSDRIRLEFFLLFIVIIFFAYLMANGSIDPVPLPITLAASPTLTSTAESQLPTATLSPSVTSTPTVLIVTTPSATLMPLATHKPFATEAPNLQITPMGATLYDITGTVNALGCPDSRCKVIDVYKKRSIVVVIGTVMGTTYKNKKTRLWYQVVFHDGRKVYVHGSFVTAHVTVLPTQATVAIPTATAIPVTPISGFICPTNCEDARAMGLSAEQAAQCPGLDGNGNGLACYGN